MERRTGKVKEEVVFLKHRSLWNAGWMPSIACWNSFFLFKFKGTSCVLFRNLFSERERERKVKEKDRRFSYSVGFWAFFRFWQDFVYLVSAARKQNTTTTSSESSRQLLLLPITILKSIFFSDSKQLTFVE